MGFLADAGIPMLVLQVPAMLVLLVPVVAIEGVLVRRQLHLTWRDAVRGSLKANLVSTFLGVPLAWIASFLLELTVGIPLLIALQRLNVSESPGAKVAMLLSGAAWLGPIATGSKETWFIPAASLVLLVPSFLVSVWLERRVYASAWQHLNLDGTSLRQSVLYANVGSYIFLFVVVCAWLGYAARTQRLGFFGL